MVQQEDIFLKNNFGIEEEIFKNPTDITINFKKGYGFGKKHTFTNVYSLQTTPKTIIIRKRGNDEETKNFLKRGIASCEIIQHKTSTIKITKKF